MLTALLIYLNSMALTEHILGYQANRKIAHPSPRSQVLALLSSIPMRSPCIRKFFPRVIGGHWKEPELLFNQPDTSPQ